MSSLRPSHRGASRAWEVTKSHRGLYSGGKLALFHPAGKPVLACLYNDDVALINVASGQARAFLDDLRLLCRDSFNYYRLCWEIPHMLLTHCCL